MGWQPDPSRCRSSAHSTSASRPWRCSRPRIQVTGNNIANAGNADYTRQVARSSPSTTSRSSPGIFVGTGVDLTAIQRQIDEALKAASAAAFSDNEAADTTQQWLGRVEVGLQRAAATRTSRRSSSTFFNSWSNLANKPQDIGLRQVVLQNGESVAN